MTEPTRKEGFHPMIEPPDRQCPKCGWLGKLDAADKSISTVSIGYGIGGSAPTSAWQSWCPNCGTKTEFYREGATR